jgi:putative Mg2+ transporter-C (MgtC) family protein
MAPPSLDGGASVFREMDVSAEDQLAIVGRVALAALLGAIIGLERELRGHPAGIRTMSLVTLGACLFTEVSVLTGAHDRIAAQIVTGIGFLGAGVIFREGTGLKGITTAATVWAAAAIGMSLGRELYVAAILGTVLILLLLYSRPLTRRVEELVHPLDQKLRRGLVEAGVADEKEVRTDD